MVKVYLDDERLAPDGYILVRTPEAFKEVVWHFRNSPIDVISFDNDLGGPIEGRHLFAWLEENIFLGKIVMPKSITVHSANPPARDAMLRGVEAMKRYVDIDSRFIV